MDVDEVPMRASFQLTNLAHDIVKCTLSTNLPLPISAAMATFISQRAFKALCSPFRRPLHRLRDFTLSFSLHKIDLPFCRPLSYNTLCRYIQRIWE